MKEKLTILFITFDNSRNVDRNSFYLTQELAKISNVILWHDAGDITEILSKIGEVPDFILLNEMKESPEVTGWTSISIPFGMIIYDLHYAIDQRKAFIWENDVPYIFSIYRDMFFEWYPEFKDRFRWLPLHVNTSIFKDYRLEKDIDWLIMGATTGWVYPLREKIVQTMSGVGGFVYHEHPGYRDIFEEKEKNVFVGEQYAKEINRSKMFFTCDSIYKYPVNKYYEVLACNTLLLASSSQELSDLGFIPGVNYVEIDENNFVEKAYYYLEHPEERMKVTEQGYKMVHKKYTTEQRAVVLKRMINEIVVERQLMTKGSKWSTKKVLMRILQFLRNK